MLGSSHQYGPFEFPTKTAFATLLIISEMTAISSATPLDGCFITLVMGERAGSRGTGWNLERDPSPARTQGRDLFWKKSSFAMGEVGCLASISCGSKLPPERDISYENTRADFSKLLPAPLWQKGKSWQPDVLAKNRSTPATHTVWVQWKWRKNHT